MNRVPNILVVDDEEDNCVILESFLNDAGYHVATAKNAEEAWNKMTFATNNVDLALLDWMMPGESGLELLQRMQKHAELRHTQVIMQTARARSEEIQMGIDAGAWYYLTKPFSEETMLAIIRTALTDRRNYLNIQKSIRARSTGELKGNRFALRTLEEAKDLAPLLAKICHDPEKRGLGFLELLLNAVEHGNLGITYEEKSQLIKRGTWLNEINRRLELPENQAKIVEVFIEHHATGISFRIKDQGQGFTWEKYLTFDPCRITHPHGRGIAMTKYISFENLEYQGNGNEVRIFVEHK